MKMIIKKVAFTATLLTLGFSNAYAGLVSVSGDVSSEGVAASIISAPVDATDDAAFNEAIQGFDEQQGYVLTNNLSVDGGMIAAGTVVDSHMLFLNSGPGNSKKLIEHGAGLNQNAVTFEFTGDVLGVMSVSNGQDEIDSLFLGATGTIYPTSTFSARGMEGNPLTGGTNDDWYSFTSNFISLGMRVTEPGDWIRVITLSQPSTVNASSASTVALFGLALAGMIFVRRKS